MARTRKVVPEAVKTAPPLNFDLMVEEVKETTVQLRPAQEGGMKLLPILRESFKLGEAGENPWRENRIEGRQVRQLGGAFRVASEILGKEEPAIGISIRYAFRNDEGEVVEIGNVRQVPEDERPVLVKYRGITRKDYSSADDTADIDEDEDDEDDDEDNGDE